MVCMRFNVRMHRYRKLVAMVCMRFNVRMRRYRKRFAMVCMWSNVRKCRHRKLAAMVWMSATINGKYLKTYLRQCIIFRHFTLRSDWYILTAEIKITFKITLQAIKFNSFLQV